MSQFKAHQEPSHFDPKRAIHTGDGSSTALSRHPVYDSGSSDKALYTRLREQSVPGGAVIFRNLRRRAGGAIELAFTLALDNVISPGAAYIVRAEHDYLLATIVKSWERARGERESRLSAKPQTGDFSHHSAIYYALWPLMVYAEFWSLIKRVD